MTGVVISGATLTLVTACDIPVNKVVFVGSPLSYTNGGITVGAQTTYYVDTGGSDSSNGLSPSSAWKTISKVNAQVFQPNTAVLFNGGQTFSGSVALTTTNAPSGRITIGSYGSGQATISSGNAAEGVTAINLPGIVVNNIICTGGGSATNTTAGISVVNNQAGNTKLSGPTIKNCTVSGYGYNGISILGNSGTSGFSGITVSGNTIHDCTGNSQDAFGTAGLMIASSTGYNLGLTLPAHRNAMVSGNTIYNVNGKAGNFNWSGTGMYVAQIETVTITFNVVHDFGSASDNITGGPGGILTADGSNMTISYNEVYNGRTALHDGGGIVLDGGLTNSVVEYNWCHDNTNYSILLENYTDVSFTEGWGSNTVRFNIFQNSRYFDVANKKGEIELHFPAAATLPAYIYNNTIINQANSPVLHGGSDDSGALTITIANNIFVVSKGPLISLVSPRSISFTGNDYYTYGQPVNFVWAGVTYASFSAWQTATSQEKISGSNVGLTSNPQIYVPGGGFTNGGYVPANLMAYNLQAGSPMIGAGMNLTTQYGIDPGTTDYFGVAVTSAALPVGAAKGDFTTFAASSAAATNFLARVSSFTKLDNVNYNSLLSSGSFATFDLLYILAAPNSAASLLNLLSASFSLTVTGSPTFTAREGYIGNGTTQFLDTGWTPSTSAVNYTLASASHFGYVLTDGKTDTQAIYGALNVAGNSETTNYPGLGGWYSDANDFSGSTESAITNSNGMFELNRSAGVLTSAIDGQSMGAHSVAAVSLPDRSIYLLASHGASAVDFSSNKLAAAGFGAGGQNQSDIYRRVDGFMMAYGINNNWVLPGAAIDMDFIGGRYYGGTLESLISMTPIVTLGEGLTVTDGVSIYRAGGALETLLQTGTFSIVITSAPLGSAASNPQILSDNTGTGHHVLGLESNTTFSSYDGAANPTATLGSGSFTGSYTKVAASVSAGNISLVGNNGTVVTGAFADSPITLFGIGWGINGAGAWMSGDIVRITAYPTKLSDVALKALTQ